MRITSFARLPRHSQQLAPLIYAVCMGLVVAAVMLLAPPANAFVLGDPVSLRSHNFPTFYIRHFGDDIQAAIAEIGTSLAEREAATFRIVPGLAGGGTVSIESDTLPGHFLRHQDFQVKLDSNDDSALFKADASFFMVPGLADPSKASFQSVNFPDRYIRHCSFVLILNGIGVGPGCDPDSSVSRADTTFEITAPLSETTPPVITISASPETLWPPNGKKVPVTLSGTITDNEPGGTGVKASTATYAVTDEYGSVQPSGKVTLGANGSYAFTIYLQASRNGNDKDGRQYIMTVSAQDNAGNMGSAATGVTVPHDQGR